MGQENLKFDATDTTGLPSIDAAASPAKIAALLASAGAVVVHNAIPKRILEALIDESNRWFNVAPGGEGAFFGKNTRRFSAVLAKCPSMVELIDHSPLIEATELVLKGDPQKPACDAIEFSITQGIGIGPGEPGQFLHRDEELWPAPNPNWPSPHPYEFQSNIMWTLMDFTPENGSTRIIPGSHLWRRDRKPEPGQAINTHAPAGSAILWLGSTLHGGGANTTDQMRRGLVTSFKLGWLAPQEKLLLSIPPELARTYPEKVQRLLGYQIHRPNLGLIEGRDPREWLMGETGEVAAARDNLAPHHEAMLADVMANPEEWLGYV